MESSSSKASITFQILQERLIKAVNVRIGNGDFSERGLARILGISQSQVHNVLKGVRKLRPELADRLIVILEITVFDLLNAEEVRQHFRSPGSAPDAGAARPPGTRLTSQGSDNVPSRKGPSSDEKAQTVIPFEQAG